jgi:choline monooxygenase
MSKPVLFEVDQQLKEDPTTSFTMPARWYLDPEIFEREKEAIFYRNWHYVTHRSALAEVGDYATLRIADESVLVIRGKDGGLQGFYNVCKHRAHELLEGSGNTTAPTSFSKAAATPSSSSAPTTPGPTGWTAASAARP